MLVTLHQPEHLPWLGFFHKMAQVDLYVVMDHLQYRHQYFQNRNRIHGVQAPVWVNVPVRKTCHRYGPIRDVLIDNSRAWRKTYWGAIDYHYRRHPHFERYAEPLHEILFAPHERLLELNMALIHFFRDALGITTPMVLSSELAAVGQKSAMIHQICQSLGATTYMSGPFGREYLQEDRFAESGIAVRYHDFRHPCYPQWPRSGFTPLLAAIDLLMNCGPASGQILLASPVAQREPVTAQPALVASFSRSCYAS